MIGKDNVSGEPVSTAQALEILEQRKKEGELGYEQDLSFKHAEKYTSMSLKEAKKLAEELSETGISKKTIIKIVDILPKTEIQLKNVLLIEKKAIEELEVKKIFEIVSKYSKAK